VTAGSVAGHAFRHAQRLALASVGYGDRRARCLYLKAKDRPLVDEIWVSR
jgi:hypothetical protein